MPLAPAKSAAQHKRFASRISSTLFATRSSGPGEAMITAKQRARLIATLKRLRDSRNDASRGMSSAPEVVIETIRAARPGAIETSEQETFVVGIGTAQK
jgi:hypothetical protein